MPNNRLMPPFQPPSSAPPLGNPGSATEITTSIAQSCLKTVIKVQKVTLRTINEILIQ